MRISKSIIFALLVGAAAYFCLSAPVRSMLGVDGAEITIAEEGEWENPYITDGLVAMWDGEWNVAGGVHDDSIKYWQDIIGGYVLRPWDTGASNFRWEENSPVFVAYMQGSFTIDTSNGFTIEVCRIPSYGGYPSSRALGNHTSLNIGVIAQGAMSLGVLGSGQNKNTWSGSMGSVGVSWYNLQNRSEITVRCIGDGSGVVYSHSDGLDMISRTTYPESGSRNFLIGSGNSAVTHRGFFNIRIYERALTDEEILHNYEVDMERFGLE